MEAKKGQGVHAVHFIRQPIPGRWSDHNEALILNSVEVQAWGTTIDYVLPMQSEEICSQVWMTLWHLAPWELMGGGLKYQLECRLEQIMWNGTFWTPAQPAVV